MCVSPGVIGLLANLVKKTKQRRKNPIRPPKRKQQPSNALKKTLKKKTEQKTNKQKQRKQQQKRRGKTKTKKTKK